MEQKVNDEALLRRYLLGELEGDELRRVEERLFLEDEFFNYLLAMEDELADDYVGGRLTPPERESFEKRFLSTPERHQTLRFARALKRYAAAEGASPKEATPSGATPERASFWPGFLAALRSPSPALTISTAVMVLAFILVAGWGLFRFRRP
jgi:anti-sigma-K factor RskA